MMKLNNETKIGVMVGLVLLSLAILTVKTAKFSFSKDGYKVKVLFKNLDGVNMNSPVMYNGYEVGVVQAVGISDGQEDIMMELTLWVKNDVKLREGSKAEIKNLGFLGEKYVNLTSGNKSGAFLASDAIIIGKEPPKFEELLAEGQVIAVELKEISQNINERLKVNKESIDSIIANLDATLENMSSLTGEVDERLKVNETSVDSIVKHLEATSANLEEMSYDLKQNPWKLLYKEKTNRNQ
ncbi:MAG: MlaD family protein [Candidatus Omnitrophota bacterium]|nr:MlaD family protein [Candidatus Omnitrophota bacterium]